MKIYNYIMIALLGSLLMSCGTEEARELTELPPVKVTLAQVSAQNQQGFVAASGKIEALKSANISTRMMGNVNKLHVKVGDQVRKGQLLVSISDADLVAQKAQVEASIVQATSGLKNAEKDYQRFKALFDKGSASEKELDDMTTRYEMAKAGLQAAEQMKKSVEAQFAYTEIKAPFDGIITNTFIKAGDMANPGMPLIAIEGNAEKQVIASVSESDISNIDTKQAVKVFVKSLGIELNGTVAELSTSARNTGGQYLVKVDLENAGEEVLPGMFVNLHLAARNSEGQGQITVPSGALVTQGQLTGIYVVNDGTAILRWLRLGRQMNDQVEVLSGLSANENYVLSSSGRLFNGAKVSF